MDETSSSTQPLPQTASDCEIPLTSYTDENGLEYKYFPANKPEAMNEQIRHCVKFYRDIAIRNKCRQLAEPEVPQLEDQQTPKPKRKKVVSPDEIFNELRRSYQRGVVIPELLEPPTITNSFEEFKTGFKKFYDGFRARDQQKLQDNYLYGQWLEKAFVHFREKKKKKENFIDWVAENCDIKHVRARQFRKFYSDFKHYPQILHCKLSFEWFSKNGKDLLLYFDDHRKEIIQWTHPLECTCDLCACINQ